MRIFLALVAAAVLLALYAAFGPATAQSVPPVMKPHQHSFYPSWCCSGQDCGPIADEAVDLTPAGWLVVETGEIISFGKAQVAPDGRFHRCPRPDNSTRCLFTPGFGS